MFVPVTRDQLIPALLDGRGDIAAANLIITPERSQLVDFTVPVLDDVNELVVTGPSGPRISRVEELAGQPVHVRQSSSYREHLEALNRRLVEQGKQPVKLVAAPEELEDEDVLEMVNAGLHPHHGLRRLPGPVLEAVLHPAVVRPGGRGEQRRHRRLDDAPGQPAS